MNKMMMKCPVCNSGLILEEKRAVCENRHSFDRAKQRYFNMLLNINANKVHGDSPEMLLARRQIFNKGYYEKISDELNKIVKPLLNESDSLLDIGSGVGYYLNRLQLDIGNNNPCFGIDISKEGIKYSSKISKDIQYIVGSNSQLPFLDKSIHVITNVFSPLYEEETKRVLEDNGYLVVVNPNQNHLMEMKKVIYQDIILKEEDRNELDPTMFQKISSIDVTYLVTFDQDDLKDILLMTPHYWKSTAKGKNRLYQLFRLTTSIDVRIDVYKKNNI